jgi:hypothetical protein
MSNLTDLQEWNRWAEEGKTVIETLTELNNRYREFERELNEANADRLRLRVALEKCESTFDSISDEPCTCYSNPEGACGYCNPIMSAISRITKALTTPPPPAVAKSDADALAEAVEIMRVGICSAAMPNATEREIASDAVKQASEVLKTYRNKYPQ